MNFASIQFVIAVHSVVTQVVKLEFVSTTVMWFRNDSLHLTLLNMQL